MVISHPTVAYLFSTGIGCLLEQGLWKYSTVRPVGAEPGPVGECQALMVFLDMEVFLSLGSPHEVGVAVVKLVVHKNSSCIESCMG